ncbi:MAG: HAMP domain-containing protein [Chloroflexota bacterium]|nr:HAMP domain-containing protein [Chloroflexota bacterium]
MAEGRRGRVGLGVKLFASYLVVLLTAVGTLLLTAGTVSPAFFSDQMRNMMAGGAGAGMMGGGMPASAMSPIDQALAGAFRASLLEGLFVAAGVALVAAVGVSLFVTDRIANPVRRLALASKSIARGHYAERVPETQSDELGELAHSFNEMAAQLEDVERRRLELIGNVAHELRTPLATLQGNLEGLLDGVVDASPQTWAKLETEVARLRRLVDDLSELSRAEARQLSLRLQQVRPVEIACAAIERLAGPLAEKGLSLETDVAETLPPVAADRDRAVQVLTNLLSNALRYTSAPGSVRLTAQHRPGAIRFSVRDSGVGLVPADVERVFERFYRVDRSRSRAAGGSGIGLTISRAVVEAMGGRIWADSPGLGQGSTFSFELPAAS